MAGRSIAVLVAIVSVAVGVGPPAASGAATHDKIVTSSVTAVCSFTNVPHPPPPERRTYLVTTQVPQRVKSGAPFSIHFSLPFSVAPGSLYGAALITGGPGANPGFDTVQSGPGSASITGDPWFTATGDAGSRLTWRLGSFGQVAIVGNVIASETCVPVRTWAVLSRTKVT